MICINLSEVVRGQTPIEIQEPLRTDRRLGVFVVQKVVYKYVHAVIMKSLQYTVCFMRIVELVTFSIGTNFDYVN